VIVKEMCVTCTSIVDAVIRRLKPTREWLPLKSMLHLHCIFYCFRRQVQSVFHHLYSFENKLCVDPSNQRYSDCTEYSDVWVHRVSQALINFIFIMSKIPTYFCCINIQHQVRCPTSNSLRNFENLFHIY
jgi:hypothetical protein